jgi:hypothetical protein
MVLLHKGIACMINPDRPLRISGIELVISGLWSRAYTGIIIVLVKAGIVRFLPDYFNESRAAGRHVPLA